MSAADMSASAINEFRSMDSGADEDPGHDGYVSVDTSKAHVVDILIS